MILGEKTKASVSQGRDHLESMRSMPVDRYRDRLLSRIKLEPGRGRVALDIGCGDGMEAEYLAQRGWKVQALDLHAHPNWPRLEKKWKKKIQFKVADVTKCGLQVAGKFDFVFQKDVLHHIPNPELLLKQMALKLKKGGKLVILECNRANPISYVHLTLMGDHQHFTRNRLKQLLKQAGIQGYEYGPVEARVWPLNNVGFQNFIDQVQNLIEKVRLFNPWLVYHLVQWKKP